LHLKNIIFYPEKFPTRERYPFNLPIFHQMKQLSLNTPVTMFVGENGTGKSTLLEALVRKCGIHIWRDPERSRSNYNPFETMFSEFISIEWTDGQVPGSFFDSAVFQDFIQMVDEWVAEDPGQLKYYGGKSLVTQSHGQSIITYFKSRYQIKGIYLLDEPETALSPKTQVELLNILVQMSHAGHAQFIIATHSPILLACPGATIYSFDQIPIKTVAYEETIHYQMYKSFMEDKNRYLDNL
jgi:predicted ATPase